MRLEDVVAWSRFAVFGHRGNPLRMAENTIESFLDAVACGADGVELDVHLSQDGVAVVCHDPRLVTAGGEEIVVRSTPWKVLSGLEVVVAGKTARLSRLEEVLDALDEQLLDVELKDLPLGDPELAESAVGEVTARVIQERGAQERTILSSFFIPHLEKAHRVAPEIPRGWLVPPRVAASDSIALASAHRITYLLPHASGLPTTDAPSLERVVDLGRRQGVDIVCWTVNDGETALRLRAAGAFGVITDDPEGIVAALEASSARS